MLALQETYGITQHRLGRALAIVVVLAMTATVHAQAPSTIYAYDMGSSTASQRVTMATLMGNVNRTSPEMFMGYQSSPAYSNPTIWLNEYLTTQPSTSVSWTSSPVPFFTLFKNRVNGYVLYNTNEERNVATSLAGLLDLVAVDASTQSLAVNAGLGMVADARGKDLNWVLTNYGSQFNKDKVFSIDPTFDQPLRDYAVQQRGLVYWNPPAATKNAILAGQNDHTQVYGWDAGVDAAGELEFFSTSSANNLKAVAANYSQSYSAISKWAVPIPNQATHVSSTVPTQDGKHYVAFVMSDGDNAQWLTNGFADDPKWWGSPYRGAFTMNWDITPEMANLAPVLMKRLYEEASTGAHKDFFVTAHGPGTDYPSEVPDYAGSVAATAASMQAVDQNILSILDNEWNTSTFDKMLARPEIDGVMFKSNWGCAYACNSGNIYWNNGKPAMSATYSLWDGFGTAQSISAAINAAPSSPRANQGSYSIVNVHPWSTGGLGNPMSNLQDLVGRLDTNVEVVTLEELFFHLRNNFGAPSPPGAPITILSDDFESGRDGWNDSGNPVEAQYPGAGVGGSTAIGFNTSTPASINAPSTWADWRSNGLSIEGGVKIRWSFKFQISSASVGQVLAELRGFDGATFIAEDAVVLSGTAGQWIEVVRDYTLAGSIDTIDLRFNNIFTNVLAPFSGNFRLDDVLVQKYSSALAGDYNLDGSVDTVDYDLWRNTFGSTWNLSADGNGDGRVDAADFVVWRDHRGAGAAVATQVPEPNAVILIGLGLLTTAFKKCRETTMNR